MMQRLWGKVNNYSLCGEMQTSPFTMEISVENHHKDMIKSTRYPIFTTPWCISKGLYKLFHRYLLTYILCCIIQNI